MRSVPRFRYELVCKEGALVIGSLPDFLGTVAAARESKREWRLRLPTSTLRVKLYYPNGERVSRSDVAAALVAINSLGGK